MEFSKEVENRVNYVINHKEKFSTRRLYIEYGIEKKTMSSIRNKKRNIENLRYSTIIKILKASDEK